MKAHILKTFFRGDAYDDYRDIALSFCGAEQPCRNDGSHEMSLDASTASCPVCRRLYEEKLSAEEAQAGRIL